MTDDETDETDDAQLMDTEAFPDPPDDRFPVYVAVKLGDQQVWRFTATGDFMSATDVPPFVLGGLEGWARRGDIGRRRQHYAASADVPDRFPALGVDRNALARLLREYEHVHDHPDRIDAYEQLRGVLDGTYSDSPEDRTKEPTGADPDGTTDVAADGEERVPGMTGDDIDHGE